MSDRPRNSEDPKVILMEAARREKAKARAIDEGRPATTGVTDHELALRFVEQHVQHFRFVPEWRRWFHWNGSHWRQLETSEAAAAARQLLVKLVPDQKDRKVRNTLQSARKLSSVMQMIRIDPRIETATNVWDRHPQLLNTPAGTIDLVSGEMRPNDPADHLTQITAVAPAATADCLLFLKMLDRIFDGNQELIVYLQKTFGYCVCGETDEQEFWFGHGYGNNGKSLLMSTVAHCMGTYHRRTAVETFSLKPQEQHPTAIADLRGARLVTATESKENRNWDEALLKEMTGEEVIKARFMHKDFFEVPVTWKIFVIGNHKPRLSNIGEAMLRRIRLVPFTVTIPAEERDRKLNVKLRAEAAGILRWMLDGHALYRKEGLQPPPIVVATTKAYVDDQDTIGQWLDECCVMETTAWTATSALIASYNGWAGTRGLFATWMNKFVEDLTIRGFVRHRHNDGNGFLGLRLKNHTDGFGDVPF
jgi:putative DNA primase/helicase